MLLDVTAILIAEPPAALREVPSAPALMRALHLLAEAQEFCASCLTR